MVLNQQRRIAVDLRAARGFVRRLSVALKLARLDFNVCFVDDPRIAELNARYRRKARPTDVLSFPWKEAGAGSALPRLIAERPNAGHHSHARQRREFAGFLGDVVISAEAARRNARSARHSTAREIRWLILHGALHLLGYDHETDRGEMRVLELTLRERLGT